MVSETPVATSENAPRWSFTASALRAVVAGLGSSLSRRRGVLLFLAAALAGATVTAIVRGLLLTR